MPDTTTAQVSSLSNRTRAAVALALLVPMLALAAAVGVSRWSRQPHLLDPHTAAILRGTDRAEGLRISTALARGEREPSTKDPQLAGYFVLGRGREIGRGDAARLADALLDGGNYLSESTACIPEPGVAFRLWRGRESVCVAVCYRCSYIGVTPIDAAGRSGKTVGASFNVGALAWAAKRAFPQGRSAPN